MDRLQSSSSSLERESASLRRCLEEKEEEVDTLSKSLSLVEVELASSQALMQELTGEMEALKKKNEVSCRFFQPEMDYSSIDRNIDCVFVGWRMATILFTSLFGKNEIQFGTNEIQFIRNKIQFSTRGIHF